MGNALIIWLFAIPIGIAAIMIHPIAMLLVFGVAMGWSFYLSEKDNN